MTTPRVWTQVDAVTADGMACVMCGRRTSDHGWSGRPVGWSPTGSQVFACDWPCADLAEADEQP